MDVGEVRIAEDADYKRFKDMCTVHSGWKKAHSKGNIVVYTRKNEKCDFKVIKVIADLKDIPAGVIYDVLHDNAFRSHWDDYCLKSFEISCLNPNNDIGYYALHCPAPLKNRDFVMLRSWLEHGDDMFIINHSINHADLLPEPQYVRAISHMVGYYIKKTGKKSCVLHYVSQIDPKGKLPSWTINKLTSLFAPRMIKKIYKACHLYDKWKSAQANPNYKPWLYPEQSCLPRVDMFTLEKAVIRKLSTLPTQWNSGYFQCQKGGSKPGSPGYQDINARITAPRSRVQSIDALLNAEEVDESSIREWNGTGFDEETASTGSSGQCTPPTANGSM